MDRHDRPAAPHGHADPRRRRYAELVRAGDGTEAERMDILQRHRAVRAQLEETQHHLELIDRKIEWYAGRTGACS